MLYLYIVIAVRLQFILSFHDGPGLPQTGNVLLELSEVFQDLLRVLPQIGCLALEFRGSLGGFDRVVDHSDWTVLGVIPLHEDIVGPG